MIVKKEGIVIKEVGYKTSDKIVSVLTNDNQIISFKAKGAKKLISPFAKTTILGSICEFELESKIDNGKYDLLEAKEIFLPYKISKSIEALSVLSFMMEAVNYIKDVPLYEIFSYLVKMLEKVNPLIIATYFISHLINWEGISLELDKCVKCGSVKSIVNLDYSLGGYLCSKCTFSTRSIDYLKMVRVFKKIDKEKLGNLEIDYDLCYKLLLDLWEHFLNFGSYKLRSFEFMKQSLIK